MPRYIWDEKIQKLIEIDGIPYAVLMNKLVDKNLFIEVLSTCFSDGKLSILKLSKDYKFEEVKNEQCISNSKSRGIEAVPAGVWV